MNTRLVVVEGDITELDVDAVVNAANTSLLGGGGVDGAIHNAAGPRLQEACRKLKGCATGEAKITPGFDLPARWIMHTVGPVWTGGAANEANLLADCYRNSLSLAAEYDIKTVAFPAIGTGAFGFPPKRAAKIAVHTVRMLLERGAPFDQIVFCTFGARTTKFYKEFVEGPEPPNPFIVE